VTAAGRPKGIAKNIAANWVAFLYVAIVGFFLSPFIVNRLGTNAYGVWSLLVAVVGYLGLLDFGVRGAVTRYVAHHHASGDDGGSSAIVSAALVLFGLLGIVAIVLAGALAFMAPRFFNIPGELLADTRVVLCLGGLTVAVTLLGAVFGGVVTGLERFDVNSGIEIVMTTIRAAAVVMALKAGYGLVALGCIHLTISALQGVVAWTAARRLYRAMRLQFRSPLIPQMRTIVTFSAFLSMLHVLSALIYYSDAVVIAAFLPIGAVAFYVIAGNLCEYAFSVVGTVSRLMTPRVSALASRGGQEVPTEILRAARIATLASASIAAVFWIRGESFISLWMGPTYGPESGKILGVLAFVVWLSGGRSVAAASIVGVSRHRLLIPGLAFEAVVNVALSIALIGNWGLVGVAIGTLVPNVLVTLAYFPRCLVKATEVPEALYYRDAWLRPTLACVPFGLAAMALERHAPAGSLAVFFGQVVVTLPLVAAGALACCLSAEERRSLVLRVKRWARERR